MAGGTGVNRKYITRVKRWYASYWLLRIKACGIKHEKTFADQKCGSEDKAFEAIIQYRDEYLRSVDALYLLEGCPSRHTTNNTSGIIGVRVATVRRRTLRLDSWQGYGTIEGEPWKRSFEIACHGVKSAFKQACRARYEHNGELAISIPISQLPCSPSVPWKRYKMK